MSLRFDQTRYDMTGYCVFCNIVRGIMPVEDLQDGGRAVPSFVPLNPVTKGHRLFVPNVHVANALEDPEITGKAFAAASKWAGKNGLTDFNLIVNNGHHATQTIPHLHVHLVPRTANDGLVLPWTNQEKSHD